VRPVVKSFVEGENACILLFGPTEGGKTFTLKGKTGMERGILPRAVEDIFNIVRNSEEREEDYQIIRDELMAQDDSGFTEQDVSTHSRKYPGRSHYNEQTMSTPERMFLKVSVYQIFVDKVLDLLPVNNKRHSPSVKLEHYIDKDSEEVVSKLKNITEKVVFTLEDFYSVL
jgi:hypothetical protein